MYLCTGGFYRSDLIRSHLIDHYVPFLPLEKEHITKCIHVELMHHQGHVLVDPNEVVAYVLNILNSDIFILNC